MNYCLIGKPGFRRLRCCAKITSGFAQTLSICVLLFLNLPLLAATVTTSIDAGGIRSKSTLYQMDGNLGCFSGISAVSNSVSRSGYIAQLTDLHTIRISASDLVIEGSTNRLQADAILDDNTVSPLSDNQVIWNPVQGPIGAITANNLVWITNVYQDTSATIEARYQNSSSLLKLTVLNTDNDDFGLYAKDKLDDKWQVQYFGLSNTNGLAISDPDGDGNFNYQEYVADTNPTNTTSCFRIENIIRKDGCKFLFQSSPNRKYTLYYSTDLRKDLWTNLISQTDIVGDGNPMYLNDPSTATNLRFYRIEVRLP